MIASPCRNCPDRDFPKNQCLRTCPVIRRLQGMQLAGDWEDVRTARDYSEVSLFNICPPDGRFSEYAYA